MAKAECNLNSVWSSKLIQLQFFFSISNAFLLVIGFVKGGRGIMPFIYP